LKAAEEIAKAHEAQLVNYLKATDIQVGLLLNFGPKAEFKRKIFTKRRK
jgi:GxxExxY protein